MSNTPDERLPSGQRKEDSVFAGIHAQFLGKYFYPELTKVGFGKFSFETDLAEQFQGVDWVWERLNGSVDYIDDKAKADNLSTYRHCDTLTSFAFEIDSIQGVGTEKVRRVGWFISDKTKTTVYNIHKVTARYRDKRQIASMDDIYASDCWMMVKSDLMTYLVGMVGEFATARGMSEIAGEMRKSGCVDARKKRRIRFFRDASTGTVYYAESPKDIKRDEVIDGVSIVYSAYNKNEEPINLVLSTDVIESVPTTRRFHIDSNGVCEIPSSMSTLTSVGRLLKAVKEIKRLKSEVSALKESGARKQMKHRDSGNGVTRVVGGVYDDIELNDGYFLSDKNIGEIGEWLKMYHDLLDATCQKKGITEGDMFVRKGKIKEYLDVFLQNKEK